MSDNLRHHVLDGTKWSAIAQAGQQISRFGLSVILARLLLPEHFGTVGMVTVFTGFATWAVDSLAAALVQQKVISDEDVQSVFWITISFGLLLTTLLFILAPFVAGFFDTPALLSITRVISFTFLISTPGLVPTALLQRQMAFQRLARTSITSTLIAGIVGILLAYMGAGVWSLVAQSFTAHIVTTGLNFYWSSWHPRFKFSMGVVRNIWGFSSNLFTYNLILYWARNADNILIGRFFGSADLGFYNRVYALMLLPVYQIVSVITKVMFPALSSIQDNPERVKRIYLRTISILSLAVSPIMIGLAVTAEPFVLTIYGQTWAPMIPLLQVLALVGLLQTFTSTSGWLFMSQGKTALMFRWGIISSGILIGSLFLGIYLGSVQTLVWCYAVANLILFYPAMIIPGSLVGIRFGEVVKVVAGPLIGAIVMAVAIVIPAGQYLIPSTWSYLAQLFALSSTGALFYAMLILVLQPSGWREVIGLVRQRI